MNHIRPYQFFKVFEAAAAERVVHTSLPYRRGAGGLTVLEMTVVMAATRIIDPKKVFEIGTFLGNTTLNIALNIADDSVIYTLDLGEADLGEVTQDVSDSPLTEIHLASRAKLDFTGSPAEKKIKILTGNSMTFDFSPWKDSVDLMFIDGGHDFATVKSDTENAFKMMRTDKPSCILWHDYLSPAYSGLSYYLDELSREQKIVHIGDTMLCAWFNDPDDTIWPILLTK
jgi:predicted O-methyltransferase YrrM